MARDRILVHVLLVCFYFEVAVNGQLQSVYLSLGNINISTNNTEIIVTNIGEDVPGGLPSLTCHTDLTACCRDSDTGGKGGLGEWYYPDGRVVQNNAKATEAGEGLYRLRNAPQVIRLARRQSGNSMSPVGSYCCQIPTTTQEEVFFCASIVLCPKISLPNNGKMYSYSDSFRGPGALATLTCSDGYIVTDSNTDGRTCLQNGRWSGNELVCGRGCKDLPSPTSGSVFYNTGKVDRRHPGTVATYSCDKTSRNCLVSGNWSKQAPTCAFPECSDLHIISNGLITYSPESRNNRALSTTATYTCGAGYSLVGQAARTCQSDETWSGEEPTCVAIGITCSDLVLPTNGMISYSDGSPNNRSLSTTAAYACVLGYNLVGQAARTCQSDETWSGEEPTCVAIGITCSDLVLPTNGMISYSDGSPNNRSLSTTAAYACVLGYNLVGQAARTCQSDATWSGEEPTCVAIGITCSDLVLPINGMISYSDDSPNNRSLSTTATYACVLGYSLVVQATRTCQNDATWSGEEPTCVVTTCHDLAAPSNGEVVYSAGLVNQRPVDSTVVYSCNDDFTLSGGEAIRSCLINGTWSGSTPTCIGELEITCWDLSPPADGMITYSSEGNNYRPVKTVATYSCDPGYALSGEGSRVCQSNKTWSGSGASCEVNLTCGDLSTPINGNMSYNFSRANDLISAVAVYSCDPGYSLNGESVRFCLGDNKTWSGSEPTCDVHICKELVEPLNGTILYDNGFKENRSVGSVAVYSCRTGYTLIGAGTRVCQTNAEWSNSAPTCKLNTCPTLGTPANGAVTYSRVSESPNTRPIDTVATYSCSPGYYLQGDYSRACQSNGTWSELATPTCRIVISCSNLEKPPNGMIRYTGGSSGDRLVNTTATYSCGIGYMLSGRSERTCLDNGTWSGLAPICKPKLSSILRVKVNETVFDEIIAFIAFNATNSLTDTTIQTLENLADFSSILNNLADFIRESTGTFTIKPLAVKGVVSVINSFGQWAHETLFVDYTSSIVQSYETIVGRAAQQRSLAVNFSEVSLVTFLSLTSDLRINGAVHNFSRAASITLPRQVFIKIPTEHSLIGVFYTLYENSALFPVLETQSLVNTTRRSVVGSPVVAATVGEDIPIRDINPSITLLFDIENQLKNTTFREGSEKCVSWNFSSNLWVDTGCSTGRNGDKIECRCTHLTNFAVLIDICSRAEDCENDLVADTILSMISYIGVVLSCIGLFLSVVTLLAFKELRKRDNTTHNVQLCIAIFCVLVVFAAGIERTEPYAGCVVVSVLIHYFSLVAVMWMGAGAVLMFQKLVIVFGRISNFYLITVSLICWLTPLIPVLITMIYDILNGTEPETDLIINRNVVDSNNGYCFLQHPGVFFGGFLGPILAIIFVNLILFIWVTIIVLRSTRGKLQRANERLKPKRALRIVVSLLGVMTIFGLTWLSAAFTFTIAGSNVVRIVFQSLFVVCGTFQGVFIFMFFCVLDKKARFAWRYACSKEKPKLDSSHYITSSVRQSTLRRLNGRKCSSEQSSVDYVKPPFVPKLNEKLSQEKNMMSQHEESPELEKTSLRDESPGLGENTSQCKESSPLEEKNSQHEKSAERKEKMSLHEGSFSLDHEKIPLNKEDQEVQSFHVTYKPLTGLIINSSVTSKSRRQLSLSFVEL